MANYPSSVFSYTVHQDNVTTVAAADYNGLAAEVAAIETGLETGLQHDLKPDATNTRALGSASLGWLAFLAAPIFLPVRKTDTGTVNDYALGGFGLALLNNASDLTITGIAAGKDGELKLLVAIGAGNVYLSHQDSGSQTANRLTNTATSGKTPLAGGSGKALYQYDATATTWRLLWHEQGAYLTPTFSAGDYTGGGGWTVTSGEVGSAGYYLKGRQLTVNIEVNSSTVTGGNATLSRKIPGGFTANSDAVGYLMYLDNGTRGVGRTEVSAAATTIGFNKADISNWSAATTNTSVFSAVTFEVQ